MARSERSFISSNKLTNKNGGMPTLMWCSCQDVYPEQPEFVYYQIITKESWKHDLELHKTLHCKEHQLVIPRQKPSVYQVLHLE